MSMVFAQNCGFSVLVKSQNYSVIFPHNKTEQVMLMANLIYNVTIDNCSHYDLCKFRHDTKIFCRLGQYWVQAALNCKMLHGDTLS